MCICHRYEVRGSLHSIPFSPASVWKRLSFGSSFSPKAKMRNQKKKKYRFAEGETHVVMSDRVPRIIDKTYGVNHVFRCLIRLAVNECGTKGLELPYRNGTVSGTIQGAGHNVRRSAARSTSGSIKSW